MRILVIEDEHLIAQSIKKGLEQESYAVDVAHDGRQGLDLASGEEYDFIILDRMLPYLDGMEVLRNLRSQGKHVSILILTAKGQLEDKVEGLDSGADDYLVKPFAFEELLARIRALNRRPKDNLGPILSEDDLILNTNTHTVSRAGKKIELTHKEYALLEYFLRHPQQTLTKDQIMSHVWSYDADILPNTVEAFVGYLRNKIDRPFKARSLIHTVRGFGYKFGKEE